MIFVPQTSMAHWPLALWFTTTCSTKRVFATCWTIDDDDDDDAGADGDDRGCGGDNSDIFSIENPRNSIHA